MKEQRTLLIKPHYINIRLPTESSHTHHYLSLPLSPLTHGCKRGAVEEVITVLSLIE